MRFWFIALLTALGLGMSACAVVTGSGNVITVDVPVGEFSQIEVSNAFEVNVAIGEEPSLTLRIDENIEPHLDVGVDGDTLRIGLEPVVSIRAVVLEADLIVPSLERIEGSGAAEIRVEDQLSRSDLEVELSGASFLEATVELESMSATLSGASEIVMDGQVGRLTGDVSGASEMSMLDLAVDQLDVELSGASSAEVTVGDSLTARLSGASSLRYKGAPPITDIQSSGASSVSQIPEG